MIVAFLPSKATSSMFSMSNVVLRAISLLHCVVCTSAASSRAQESLKPGDAVRPPHLVVYLGLPKTGTTAFHSLSGDLGIPSYHVGADGGLGWDSEGVEARRVRSDCARAGRLVVNHPGNAPDYAAVHRGIGKMHSMHDALACFFATIGSDATGYRALSDDPWGLLYRDIDALRPDTRFVLPERDPAEWAHAFLTFFNNSQWWAEGCGDFLRVGYGVCDDGAQGHSRLMAVYQGHVAAVKDYFLGLDAPPSRRARLLVLSSNRSTTATAQRICEFAWNDTRDCSSIARHQTFISEEQILQTPETFKHPLGMPRDNADFNKCIASAANRLLRRQR